MYQEILSLGRFSPYTPLEVSSIFEGFTREIHPYPTVWWRLAVWNQYFADNYETLGPCDLFMTSWILRVLHLHCLLGQHCFQIFNIYTILFVLSSHDLAIALFNNRSLAGSSVGLLHFVLRPLQALRLCDPRPHQSQPNSIMRANNITPYHVSFSVTEKLDLYF